MNYVVPKKFIFSRGKLFIYSKTLTKNSHFVLTIFWITILFQLTMLKNIWAIEAIARFFNLVTLVTVSLYAAYSIFFYRFRKNVWHFYIMPGLLVFLGLFLNITLNSVANFSVVNYFGLMLPWAIYMAMPALLKKNVCNSETLWHCFYYFMLIIVILGLLESFLVFTSAYSLRMISIPTGKFLAGSFSILHLLKDGSPYYRFYACFGEPGTLAMFLLPVVAYAYFHKKYIGLVIFIIGLYRTESTGGMIGLAILIPLLLYVSTNKRKIPLFVPIFVLILSLSVIMLNYMGNTIAAYEKKTQSSNVRIDNFTNTIKNLPAMIIVNPIGFKLTERSMSASQSKYYFGSNFTLGRALHLGGFSAFLGYLLIIVVFFTVTFLSIIRKNLSLEEKTVFCSLVVLFPFIIQRTTVWDSAICAFLFAPSIIRFLEQSHYNRVRKVSVSLKTYRERKLF